jgi:hypothetical protein
MGRPRSECVARGPADPGKGTDMSQSTQQTPGWGLPPTTPPPRYTPEQVKRRSRIVLAVVGAVAVVSIAIGAAVGGGGKSTDTTATTAATAATANAAPATTTWDQLQQTNMEAAFVAKARTLSFGNLNLATAKAADIITLGKQVADLAKTLGDSSDPASGMGIIVQGLVNTDARPTRAQARAFAEAAITNLAPEYSYLTTLAGQAPPTTAKPKPAAPTFGEGVYKVGVDIQPGLYKATVTSGMGYWARLADPDGNNILANDLKESGTMYLRVRSTDRYIEISGATFHKVG